MGEIDGRQHAGQAHHGGGPAFDLVLSKLHRPTVRPGTVRRSSLIDRLARDDPQPIVSVVAPAGYGKTTLLAQWAERNEAAFAWVSVDEADNDPKVLLTYVAQALDAVEPVGRRVFGSESAYRQRSTTSARRCASTARPISVEMNAASTAAIGCPSKPP